MFSDLRFAPRQFRRSPGFATVAILSLGLAIGANATIFSVINSILLRPLPVDRPDQLYIASMQVEFGADFLNRGADGAGCCPSQRSPYVLGESLRPVLVGALIGLPGAVLLARTVRSQLYGMSPIDPITYVSASAALVVVTLIAAYVPARRASRLEPMSALREG